MHNKINNIEDMLLCTKNDNRKTLDFCSSSFLGRSRRWIIESPKTRAFAESVLDSRKNVRGKAPNLPGEPSSVLAGKVDAISVALMRSS
jgi:hypothetical protein